MLVEPVNKEVPRVDSDVDVLNVRGHRLVERRVDDTVAVSEDQAVDAFLEDELASFLVDLLRSSHNSHVTVDNGIAVYRVSQLTRQLVKVAETKGNLRGSWLQDVFVLRHLVIHLVKDPGSPKFYRVFCCGLQSLGLVQNIVKQGVELLLEGVELEHLVWEGWGCHRC